MLKLRLGNQIINLFKTKKGTEVPGHLYCKRIPSAGGGYDYFYRTESGKCGDSNNTKKAYTMDEAKKAHPEHFTPLESKFLNLHQDVKNIIFEKFSNLKKPGVKKAVDTIRKNFNSSNWKAYRGYAWEAFYLLHKEIGSGHIRDINDASEYLNSVYDSSNDEKKAMIDRFFHIYTAIHDIETSEFNGVNLMNELWNKSGKTWNNQQAMVEEFTNGRLPDPAKWIVQPVSRVTGQHVVADYTINHPDLPSFMGAITLKASDEDADVSKKDGPWETSVIGHYLESGVDSIRSLGQKMDKKVKEIRAIGAKKKSSTDDVNATISSAMAEMRHNILFVDDSDEALNTRAELANFTVDLITKLDMQPGATDTIASGFITRRDGTSYASAYKVSDYKKSLDRMVANGTLSWQQNQTGTYKGIDGKTYKKYGTLSLYLTDNKTANRMKLVGNEHRSGNRHQLRIPESTNRRVKGDIAKNNAAATNLLAVHNGLIPTREGTMGFKLSTPVTLYKSAQTTERVKMNAKYIRKELTESGRVRYIYKETNPRTKKVDEVEPVHRKVFDSMIDSVDPAYKALFSEAYGEIADEHFVNINAGCTSVRFTGDVDIFMDNLAVPQELRTNETFTSSSGSFNVNRGRMAFCTSNFPDDVSASIKKAIMMHEVGHAFFYGTLRIKHKKPLTADAIDSKDKAQKTSLKDATKFVDKFGKIDKEIRDKADEEVTIADVKGQDKEMMLEETIRTYMVSDYATLSGEEHFAEAFSRYFIMPEQLKKKEKEVYDHFEAFFQKYGD